MSHFPFFEEPRRDGSRIRTFSGDVEAEELVWHRDDEDRSVHVLQSTDWWFQRDGELPIEMRPGDVIRVHRREWHRVIRRGQTPLIVEITSP